jgi:hypothetical protein
MAGTAFLDAMRQSHADRVARHAEGTSLLKTVPALTVVEQLGAIVLDATDLTPADAMRGTTVLVHDDPQVVDCVYDALKWLYCNGATQLALFKPGSYDAVYTEAVSTGRPVVIVIWSRNGFEPQDAVLLADRDIEMPDVGRADYIARLTWSVSGGEVWLADVSAERFGAEALIRCIQHGSTTADCERRLRLWLDGADRIAAKAAEAETKKSLPKLKATAAVPVGVAAAGVVRRLSEMTGFGDAATWGVNLGKDLRAYKAGTLAWSDVDRGILLSGPPGSGKTTFAKALSLETDCELVPTTYSEWSAAGGLSGDSMSKGLTKLFDKWRSKAESGPIILFIDEIDSMGARGGAAHNESWYAPIVNAWLAFLDGAVPRDGIVVVGATNHVARVDPAMLRPGRLDRHVELPMPDVEVLLGMIRAHLGSDAIVTEAELVEAARAVRGRSPADVELLCRDARRMARWYNRRVCASDLTDVVALQRVGRLPDADHQTAVHEAGHAVACVVLGVDSLSHVDLDAGRTSMLQRPYSRREHIDARLVMCLAARAAEETVLGGVTNGAAQDLADATAMAYELHGTWGMGALGLVSLSREVALHDRPLREAVRETLDAAYVRAVDLVTEHRAAIDRVAEALVARRYLDGGEVRSLLSGPMPKPAPVRRSAPSMGGRVTRTVGPIDRQGPT